MNNITPVVKNLIIINVIIFFGTIMIPEGLKQYGQLYFYESDLFRPFQIVTSMFMHADVMHLLFNMFSLYFLGPYVERVMGGQRFLLFYILCGLGASAAHIGMHAYNYYDLVGSVNPENLEEVIKNGRDVILSNRNYSDPTMGALNRIINVGALGASGAVYGVLIAFAAMFPNVKMMVFPIPFPIAAKWLALALIGFGVYNGFGGAMDGIAHFAHLGGALTGFILVYFWRLLNLR